MEWWKAVAHPGMHTRSLAGLLLLVRLPFLLPPGVALRWFGCAFLAHTSRTGYTPVPSLRVLLRCRTGWLRFPRFATMFGLACPMFGLGPQAPMGTLLGWMLTTHTFLWHLRRSGKPRALVNVPLHLLTQRGYGTEAGPTHETHIVMCTDNVVQVHWTVYVQNGQHDMCGLCPSLVSSDRKIGMWTSVFRICSSCNSPNGVTGPPWNTMMIYGQCCIFTRSRRPLRCSIVAGDFGGASIDTLAGSVG